MRPLAVGYEATSAFRRALCDAQVCMLRWLVRHGMIHRDWKPDNLFVLDDGSFKVRHRSSPLWSVLRGPVSPVVSICHTHGVINRSDRLTYPDSQA